MEEIFRLWMIVCIETTSLNFCCNSPRIKFGGESVTRGNKAIKISCDDSSLPLDADVVACQEHRNYHSYPATGESKETETTVVIACQGGGSHTAFTAGVLRHRTSVP